MPFPRLKIGCKANWTKNTIYIYTVKTRWIFWIFFWCPVCEAGARKTTCFCFPDTSANQTPLQQNLNKLGAGCQLMSVDDAGLGHLSLVVMIVDGLVRTYWTWPRRSCEPVASALNAFVPRLQVHESESWPSSFACPACNQDLEHDVLNCLNMNMS
jgi:hypothetical protein